MKRYPGMNILRGVLLVLSLAAAACGGEKSVASKSAAAYREAQETGIPVGGGHEHGGHAAPSTAATDHSAHGAMSDAGTSMEHSAHAGMNHGTASATGAMDHSAHGATGAVDHAAMGHGTTRRTGAADHAAMGHGTARDAHAGHTASANAHAGHGAPATASAAHAGHASTPAAATHDQHAGMQHGTQRPAADPHAQHAAGTPASAPIAAAPRSNAELQRVTPAATLRSDAFDAPAPAAVAEAAKAAQGGGHEGHDTRGITPGQDRENPPTPMPATRDGSSSRNTSADHSQHDAAAAVYTCPMHPEVTSDQPGTCPKCGMALVKKK